MAHVLEGQSMTIDFIMLFRGVWRLNVYFFSWNFLFNIFGVQLAIPEMSGYEKFIVSYGSLVLRRED